MIEAIDAVATEIIGMERAALDRWGTGDPSGYLEICAPDVVYFDPFLERRIDGLAGLTAHYDGIRGKIRIDRYELLNPLVQQDGKLAVLTFNYVSWGARANPGGIARRYRRDSNGCPQRPTPPKHYLPSPMTAGACTTATWCPAFRSTRTAASRR